MNTTRISVPSPCGSLISAAEVACGRRRRQSTMAMIISASRRVWTCCAPPEESIGVISEIVRAAAARVIGGSTAMMRVSPLVAYGYPPAGRVASAGWAGRAEEGQDGADPVVVGVRGLQPGLGEDAGHVGLDGPRREVELLGDAEVGPALGHLGEHRLLAVVQHADQAGRAVALQQPGHDRLVD